MQKKAQPQKGLQTLRTMAVAKPSRQPLHTWQVKGEAASAGAQPEGCLQTCAHCICSNCVAFCSRDGGTK